MADKPSALTTENVFLDTCIFVAENYSSTAYHTLIRLGAIGAVKLKTTDITLREVKAQIAEKVADGIKSLRAKSAKSGVLRNFEGYSEFMKKLAASKAEMLATELWERVEAQLKHANVEIICASTIAAGPIFHAYFAQKPPFGTGEKRKEFPDAFTLAALEAWCEQNGEELYVITTDGTVRAACEASHSLYPLEKLADFVDGALRRDEYVERAMEYLQEHTEPIKDAMKEAIEDRYVHLEDEDGDGEATVNEIESIYVDDVVESEDDRMVLRCTATVDLTASVSYDDPDMIYWDSEDKVAISGGSIRADLDRTIDVSAEVTILWENHADYVVETVVVNDGDPIKIYVDEHAETNWK
ncbi:MAG TPA: PIN domain-containing protein [Bryobacteraceae bacterium]|jgi:hypothetical protein|nr:PIN domain-containing protein [Bryobacteraceae bacterium]